MLNRTGPSTEPWGTPLVTGHQLCLEFRGNADKFKAKLLKCLERLSELPSTADILVETGVGKTVTSLQKHELVGDFVKNFTGRWEKLVPVSQKADPTSLGSEEWDYERHSARKRHHEPSFREDEEPEEEDSEPFQPPCSQSCNPDHREKKSRRTAAFSLERLHKASFKEHLREAPVARGSKEEQRVSDGTKEQNQESGTSRKEKLPMLPQLEEPVDNHVKKQKHWDSEKSKLEKPKLSLETSNPEREKGKAESDWTNRMNKKGGSGSLESSQRKCEVPDMDNKSVGFSSHSGEGEVEDEFERPTMSFESYLCYDQPQKKRKKVVKPLVSAEEKDQGHSKQSISKASTKSLSSSQKSPSHRQTSEEEAEKPPEPPKPKRIILDVVPTLPDIPLPPTQANYHLQPSVESISCSQTERKRELGRKIAVSSPVEESETGFTGRRLNSKTQVYSGSKSATLPKVMPLYQQCIRVLSNNIDSISDVGGVPFSVLEPVLERCTPEQLYRIEECNHVLTEDTDQLWHNHCVHDFKNEKPGESESWREMYLRLHDTREQRLLMLVQKFRSAHANKPKGRVAQMASVKNAAKLPLNVRRRQKKFGAGGPLLPEKTKIKPVLYTSSKSHVRVNDEQSYDGLSTSSAHSVPSSGSTFSSYDPRKPPVKKIEPMMAKTIKAFKNRLSRR